MKDRRQAKDPMVAIPCKVVHYVTNMFLNIPTLRVMPLAVIWRALGCIFCSWVKNGVEPSCLLWVLVVAL